MGGWWWSGPETETDPNAESLLGVVMGALSSSHMPELPLCRLSEIPSPLIAVSLRSARTWHMQVLTTSTGGSQRPLLHGNLHPCDEAGQLRF